jgi:hypothetical protein
MRLATSRSQTRPPDANAPEAFRESAGTILLAAAMPMVMQKKKVFICLFGMAVNPDFNYPKYSP